MWRRARPSRGPLYEARPGRVMVVDAVAGKLLRVIPTGDWFTRDILLLENPGSHRVREATERKFTSVLFSNRRQGAGAGRERRERLTALRGGWVRRPRILYELQKERILELVPENACSARFTQIGNQFTHPGHS